MKKVFLAVTFMILANHTVALALLAQANSPSQPRSISKCSSGLRGGGPDCAADRRLLVAVTLNGSEPSPEVLFVVAIAASASGAFALDPSDATKVDSAVYAVMTIRRDSQGNYTLDRSVAGAKVKSPDTCRGSSSGRADDMGFGAYLALQTQKLVRCVQSARGAPTR